MLQSRVNKWPRKACPQTKATLDSILKLFNGIYCIQKKEIIVT